MQTIVMGELAFIGGVFCIAAAGMIACLLTWLWDEVK